MPGSKYKVFAVGAPVGEGATQSVHVGVAAVAKKANPQEPFIVCNELICGGLARALVLPCPPGALLETGGETHYFSLNFNLAGQSLPPAPVDTIVSQHPELSWGVILFDVLVMNHDRHRKNISYDMTRKKLQIFDHSHALLRPKSDVTALLAESEDRLCIGNHCLAAKITNRSGMDAWVNRIGSIPNFFIEELIKSSTEAGLPKDLVTPVSDFLKRRRDKINNLLQQNHGAFPVLPVVP